MNYTVMQMLKIQLYQLAEKIGQIVWKNPLQKIPVKIYIHK